MTQLQLSLYSREEELRVAVSSSLRKLEHSDLIIVNERLVSSRLSASGKPNIKVWLKKFNEPAKEFIQRVCAAGFVVEYQLGKPVEPKPVKKTKKRAKKIALEGKYITLK